MNAEYDRGAFENLSKLPPPISVIRLIRVLVSRWYWIAGAIISSGLLCYLYLKIARPSYEARTTLRFHEKQSELDDIRGRNNALVFWRIPKEHMGEKYNVRSPRLIKEALNQIDYPFTFFRLKDLRKIDVYPFRPVAVTLLSFDQVIFEDGTFELDESLKLHYHSQSGTQLLPNHSGALIEVPGLSFRLDSILTEPGFRYQFTLNHSSGKVQRIADQLSLKELEENLPIMELTYRSGNETFARDFLISLVDSYHTHTLTQRQASANLTMRFIEEQKTIFSDSLRRSAIELEQFKRSHLLHDVSLTATELSYKLRSIDEELLKLQMQESYTTQLESLLHPQPTDSAGFLPIGLEASADPELLKLAELYNRNLTKRNELGLIYTDQHPLLKANADELNRIKAQVRENILRQKEKNRKALSLIQNAAKNYQNRFAELPRQERSFLYLQSKLEAHQSIYTLLLNKEVESAMIKAGTLPAFTVLSPVEVRPLFPERGHIWALFLFAGLFTGITLILAKRKLTSRFHQIAPGDLPPPLTWGGVVPIDKTNQVFSSISRNSGQTIFGESVNRIRSRLIFSQRNRNKAGKLIAVTSQMAGEGKSFLTVHLALSLSRISKKVLLIDGDLRRPSIGKYLGVSGPGLSAWLQDHSLSIEELIRPSPIQTLDVLPSGNTPNLPGELLLNTTFDDLLLTLRTHYDYILLDTAPLGLVTDNAFAFTRADHLIFVIRWLYSDSNAVENALQLSYDYGLPELMVVVNGFYTDHLYDDITQDSARPDFLRYYRKYFKESGAYLTSDQRPFR